MTTTAEGAQRQTQRVWSDFEAMLFDLDGVILQTAAVHAAAWKRMFDEFLRQRSADTGGGFVPFDIESDYRLYLDGRRRTDGIKAFFASRGIAVEYGSPDDPPDLLTCNGLANRKTTYFRAELAEHGVAVFNDAVGLLDVLSASDRRMAVVSASEHCTELLDRVGLLDRFEVRVTGIEAARWGLASKPAPAMFLKAADLLGLHPSDAIVFEDAISGVQAGRAGGFGMVVGVDRKGQQEELARSGADLVLSDLTDLLHVRGARPVAITGRLEEARYEALLLRLSPDAPPDPDLVAAADRLREAGAEVVVTDGDPSAPLADLLGRLAERGVGSGLVMVLGWLTHRPATAQRAVVASVLPESPESAQDMHWIGGGGRAALDLIADQVERRRTSRVPSIDVDPAWTVTVRGHGPNVHGVRHALLTLADTRFSVRGYREEDIMGAGQRMLAAGIYDESVDPPELLPGPSLTHLNTGRPFDHSRDRRTLDLHTGVLVREQAAAPVPLRSLRFLSLARPGCFALRAEGADEWLAAGDAIMPPVGHGLFLRQSGDGRSSSDVRTAAGGAILTEAWQHEQGAGERRMVERLACNVADADGDPQRSAAVEGLQAAQRMGFDALLAEHRAAWAQRWDECLISIEGDPELELAVRFCLFNLIASAGVDGESAVGPRGMTGSSYRGHVFWDTDVFLLPFFAATRPAAARAMLQYRIARLDQARQRAREAGYAGAHFPWESARTGADVTPRIDQPPFGPPIPILTGDYEEHITSDVAWAALEYLAWTGDEGVYPAGGADLVLEAARYWAARVEMADDGGHISDVIGPDEYHERVSDNAFTNVMARWTLRAAATLADAGGASAEEAELWRTVADSLVDNYDPGTGRYEQFRGYQELEPLMITDLGQPPVAADLRFGRERIQASQIIKQADVLMLHHLVPDEVEPGSLEANLDYYAPRCAHGSSLSPAIHAGLFARAGNLEEAVRLLRIAARIDLDDVTGTTAGGLHLATFGGVWQALVYGFAGVRPLPHALHLDPRVPAQWGGLTIHLQYRGSRLRVRAEESRCEVHPDAPMLVEFPGLPVLAIEGPTVFERTPQGWRRQERAG